MHISYIAQSLWNWFLDPGIPLALLILLALLVPRAGRLAMYIIRNKVVDEQADEQKTQLAFAGVFVYAAQILAYFLIFVAILQQLGFSLASAAIPATAASAAIGLGAQSIIADFLAGFFILSEKQYGVGDWVIFKGGSADAIEGTVIQITMRSTRIRTLAEETVIIPNSKAGVSINCSNHWSSAVVSMPVPLLGSHSVDEAVERATSATQRALDEPNIREVVLGPLAVHPALAINPPASVGMPWTMQMRFLTQVKPGSQWMVERAVRVKIIEEFWHEYGSAATIDGRIVSELEDTQTPHSLATQATTVEYTPQEGTMHPSSAERLTERGFLTDNDPAVTDPAQEDDAEPTAHSSQHIFTFGGRVRLSTALMLLAGIILLAIKAFTLEPEPTAETPTLLPQSQIQPAIPSETEPEVTIVPQDTHDDTHVAELTEEPVSIQPTANPETEVTVEPESTTPLDSSVEPETT
ncbi:mechanosensitive ion channel [Corynebacterium sp. ES2794-CONJ1]|uniref:mechanosensitive ion channel domain-containing protein n=1 Tax=unclassified Corynebacterium TaxID=2624378 RepID=UPI00216A62CD|nr:MULTISPECIES: mechanosensitive ion channel domain-containing protein [unclassified Corynebacterium]MCS4489779.1 mechanosensitive ion channel [Corynebacterium sp. ES2775-CONJ]MCS4491857.1 mechanosensitive ion channel [Corynebacterium sp. ES2715-CONJ3]MCS4531962.1 mechanosensitive ion channel [Corynebacterium sp. ES2730-CONJ]MCU9519363.1 mechanosensitive ion channel [Corynebacterium sp. ES2794-CONJ1]